MDLIHALSILRRRWWWAAILVLPAAFIALSSAYHVSLHGLRRKSIEYGAAQTQLLVDSPQSILATATENVSGLAVRAEVFAQFFQTPVVKSEMARVLHVLPGAIAVMIPNPSLSASHVTPTSGQSNAAVLQASDALQLQVAPEAGAPLISLYAQGPSGPAAAALANAAARALRTYVATLKPFVPSKAELAKAASLGIQPPSRVSVTQLGVAQGAMVDSGASRSIALLVFVGLLLLDCVIVIMIGGLVDHARAAREIDHHGPGAHPDFKLPASPPEATSERELETALAASRK